MLVCLRLLYGGLEGRRLFWIFLGSGSLTVDLFTGALPRRSLFARCFCRGRSLKALGLGKGVGQPPRQGGWLFLVRKMWKLRFKLHEKVIAKVKSLRHRVIRR